MRTTISMVLSLVLATLFSLASFATAPLKVGLNGRYIITGIVEREEIAEDSDDNSLRYIFIVDSAGEEWCYAYSMDATDVPPVSQKVTLVMNSNGTTNNITDDIIEDILWCFDPAED